MSKTINFPDIEKEQTVIDAVADLYNYQEMIEDPKNPDGPGIPNPQTKGEFFNAHIVKHLEDIYISQQSKKAEVDRQSYINTARDFISGITITNDKN